MISVAAFAFSRVIYSIYATRSVNNTLRTLNDTQVGKRTRVSDWIFPARIAEVQWEGDYPGPVRFALLALDDLKEALDYEDKDPVKTGMNFQF